MPEDSAQPPFWDERYRAARTPWDFGGVPEALQRFLADTPPLGRVLIPGCGTGHEVRAFLQAGWQVTAIDFSPAAVERVRAGLPGGARTPVDVVLGDFFTHPLPAQSFDAVYERTFLCALAPTRWSDVVRRVVEVLKPGGSWFGFYFFGDKDDGPPYGLAADEARHLFDRDFEVTQDERAIDSLPLFVGRERWQVRQSRH
jgi:SAM-dependent methyltransferase